MSYRISSKISADKLEDYATSVSAALHASKQTRDLAPAWFALVDEVDKLIAERKKSHRKTTIARAVVRVSDVHWDSTMEKVADKAWMLSGKNRKQAPYQPLFGDLTAGQVKRFGAQKAVSFGDDFLERLIRQENPELLPFVDEVREVNEALKQADKDRKAAVREERMYDFPRLALVDKTQELVNKTEIALLSMHPGNRELVRAILSPTPTTRRRRKAAAKQAATAPQPAAATTPELSAEKQASGSESKKESENDRTPSPAHAKVEPAELEAPPYRTEVDDDEVVVIE